MTGQIDYGGMMHRAMQGLIADVLTVIADGGLPGAHHFYITFDTRQPGVEMSDWLRERYPEDMTIVIQHWFDALTVRPDGFGITLNFGNSPERLEIPFDALRTFVDPSVEFGLRFDSQPDPEDDPDPEADTPPETGGEAGAEADSDTPAGAEVVSLDKWRR